MRMGSRKTREGPQSAGRPCRDPREDQSRKALSLGVSLDSMRGLAHHVLRTRSHPAPWARQPWDPIPQPSHRLTRFQRWAGWCLTMETVVSSPGSAVRSLPDSLKHLCLCPPPLSKAWQQRQVHGCMGSMALLGCGTQRPNEHGLLSPAGMACHAGVAPG